MTSNLRTNIINFITLIKDSETHQAPIVWRYWQ